MFIYLFTLTPTVYNLALAYDNTASISKEEYTFTLEEDDLYILRIDCKAGDFIFDLFIFGKEENWIFRSISKSTQSDEKIFLPSGEYKIQIHYFFDLKSLEQHLSNLYSYYFHIMYRYTDSFIGNDFSFFLNLNIKKQSLYMKHNIPALS